MPARVMAVLLVAACAASILAAGRWVKAQQEALRRLPRPPATSAVAARPFESLDVEDLRLTTEAAGAVTLPTNPFSPERVPPAASGMGEHGLSSATPPPPPKPQWLYKGVMTMGGQRRAVIEEVKSGETRFVKVGERLGELKVLDIAADRVVLSNPNNSQDQRVLELVE